MAEMWTSSESSSSAAAVAPPSSPPPPTASAPSGANAAPNAAQQRPGMARGDSNPRPPSSNSGHHGSTDKLSRASSRDRLSEKGHSLDSGDHAGAVGQPKKVAAKADVTRVVKIVKQNEPLVRDPTRNFNQEAGFESRMTWCIGRL